MFRRIYDGIQSFYDRVYATRTSGLLFSIATMNMTVIVLSALFEWDEYSGYKPLKWLAVSILTGLLVYEIRKSKRGEGQRTT